MPTNRVRRRQDRREGLTPSWRFRLETGRWPNPADLPGEDPAELANVFIAFRSSGQAGAMWETYREDIVADWIAAHPGSRPWGWWKFEASEPRAVVRGTAMLKSKNPSEWEWVWKDRFGLPCFRQVRPRGAALPLIESQGSYLRRLGLLARRERCALDPEDFEPEEHDPFIEEEDTQ